MPATRRNNNWNIPGLRVASSSVHNAPALNEALHCHIRLHHNNSCAFGDWLCGTARSRSLPSRLARSCWRLRPAVNTHLEPARLLHDTHGIDVSHHQGRIDWKAVANERVAFAFIKATEGGDFVGQRFAENWPSAADAGIRRGAYQFLRQCRLGAVQAENFIRVVRKDVKALRQVVDVEHMGPCLSSPQA